MIYAFISFLLVIVYKLAKFYFMLAGILYVLVLLGMFELNTFVMWTGIISILYLISNIKWYFFRG